MDAMFAGFFSFSFQEIAYRLVEVFLGRLL
jgi:hypothetical protein